MRGVGEVVEGGRLEEVKKGERSSLGGVARQEVGDDLLRSLVGEK